MKKGIVHSVSKLPGICASLPSRSPLVSCIVLGFMLAVLPFNCQSNHAEKSTLIISNAVHVYRTSTPSNNYPGTDFIAVIGPKDQVKVMEVVRKPNYVAVRVRLADGREGWVFSGEGIGVN